MKLCNYLENLLFPVLGIISKGINWLRRHSDFIVALATLITSVVACHLSYEQRKIVDTQLELMRREKQPIFEITQSIIDSDYDNVYDTECMTISIVKNEVKEICSIKCSTYYKVEKYYKSATEFRIDSVIYVPVSGYFGSHGDPYGHSGVVACDTTNNNYRSYILFREECLNKSMEERRVGYSCDKIDFIEISYQDIYGKDDTVYYEGTRRSTKEQYQYVDNLAKKTFGNNSIHFYLIKFDDVQRGGAEGYK